MAAPSPAWRRFAFPLNVFMHVLGDAEDEPAWLHYGIFERDDEPLVAAQERATGLLLSRLSPPPARLLDVGAGLGTTLRRLTDAGYDIEGITPSEAEVAAIRERHGEVVRVHRARFEEFDAAPFDAVLFHESSQYIDAEALFARARALAPHVLVLDEFALRAVGGDGALHSRDRFVAAAERHGFVMREELDVSRQAAPTTAYFADRIPALRDRLVTDLDLTPRQLDDLIESGARYRARYDDGSYGYRLLTFAARDADRPVRLARPMSVTPVNSVRDGSPAVAGVSAARELEVAHDRERRAQRRLEALEAELVRAQQELAHHVAERAQLVADREAAVARAHYLEELLSEQREQLDVISGSKSWRLTRPLRNLKQRLAD